MSVEGVNALHLKGQRNLLDNEACLHGSHISGLVRVAFWNSREPLPLPRLWGVMLRLYRSKSVVYASSAISASFERAYIEDGIDRPRNVQIWNKDIHELSKYCRHREQIFLKEVCVKQLVVTSGGRRRVVSIRCWWS